MFAYRVAIIYPTLTIKLQVLMRRVHPVSLRLPPLKKGIKNGNGSSTYSRTIYLKSYLVNPKILILTNGNS